MSRTLGDAVFRIRPDMNGFGGELRQGVATQAAASGRAFGDQFTRDASGRLRDGNGRFVTGAGAMGQAAGTSAGKGFKSRFSSFLTGGDLLKPLAAYAGAKGLAGAIGGSINLAKDFDLTIRQVGVQTGQTGGQLKELSDLALQMGQDTVFGAKDAGQAMLELAKGGLTAAQIKGGALQSSLLLAAAGGLSLADASTFVVQGMTTYGLTADKARQVSVALAGGANASTASVESLGQALSQVGPGAKNAGLSLQDTVAVLAAFDNAGIKGSDAGTSLKTMLQRLVPSTDKQRSAMDRLGLSFVDANGNIDDITVVAQKLQNKLSGLSQEQRIAALQTIFGSDATRAATVLMDQGAAGIEKYIRATKNQKAAQDLAKTAMEGAQGAVENFTGNVETLGIKVGTKLLPTFTSVTNKTAGFVEGMTKGTGAGGEFVDTLDQLYSAAKPVVSVATGAAHAFGDLPGPLRSTLIQAGLLALVMPRLRAGFASAGAGVGGNVARLQQFRSELSYTETRGAAVSRAMGRVGSAARSAAGVGGILALSSASRTSNKGLEILGKVGGGAMLGFSVAGPYGAAIGAGVGALLSLSRTTVKTQHAFRLSKGAAQEYAASLDQVSGAATRASRAQIAADLTKKGAVQTGLKAGVSQRTLVGAALGDPRDISLTKAAVAGLTDQINKLQDARSRNAADTTGLTGAAYQAAKRNADEYDAKIARLKGNVKALSSVYGQYGADLERTSAKQRIQAASTADLSKAYRNVPKNVTAQIDLDGAPATEAELVKLTRQFGLVPSQITTVSDLLGFPTTLKRAGEIYDAAMAIPKSALTKTGAPGSAAAKAALDRVTGSARTADKQRPSPKVTANTGTFFDKLAAAISAGNRAKASARLDLNTDSFYAKLARASAQSVTVAGAIGTSGPKRASGGLVKAGRGYTVGEFGREFFIPQTDGRIASTQELRAAQSPERSSSFAARARESNGSSAAEVAAAAVAQLLGGGLVLQVGDEQFDAHVRRKTDARIRDHADFVASQGRSS